MRHWIQRFRKWWAHRSVKYLEKRADLLPSPDQELATRKRIQFYESHLRDGTSWRFSKQIVEVRLMADERLQLMTKCVRAIRRVTRFDPDRQLSDQLAGRLARIFGKAPSNFKMARQDFSNCQEKWKKIVSEAQRVRNPLFASQVFSKLSEHSRLETASLVIGGLVAAGAVQMMFFYKAAAEQFIFAYWVWDDIVVQAINVVPFAVAVLLVSEMFFRVLRWSCEKLGHLGLVLFFLHHPTLFASLFSLFFVCIASFIGYHQGVAVWAEFKSNNGGKESATLMDQTYITKVHLVGTTSRTAVFLQAKTADTKNGDESQAAESPICRSVPGYFEVLMDVVCTQPFPSCKDDKRSNSGNDKRPDPGYRVYVMDRDKIVCHAEMGQCEEIPYRNSPTGRGPAQSRQKKDNLGTQTLQPPVPQAGSAPMRETLPIRERASQHFFPTSSWSRWEWI